MNTPLLPEDTKAPPLEENTIGITTHRSPLRVHKPHSQPTSKAIVQGRRLLICISRFIQFLLKICSIFIE